MTSTATDRKDAVAEGLCARLDRECPGWGGRLRFVLDSADGDIAGYGCLDRDTQTLTVTTDPQGVRLLS